MMREVNQPLISVIVPIYGIERYIGLCIESILNQTYANIEIILVDDGSPDRCGEICDLYAQKDPRIRVIHKKNGGLVSARKAGLLAATGDLIGYVDGDDWIDPDFYGSLVAQMMRCDADIAVAGQSRDLFSQSVHLLNVLPAGVYEGEELEKLRASMISQGDFYRPGITTYVWNKLFRREVLLNAQLQVDERITIGEDGAVTYPALMVCKKVCVTEICGYHYRQREDSMLKKSATFQSEASGLRVLYEYLLEFAREHPQYGHLERQIVDYLLGICMMRAGGVLPGWENQPFETAFGENFKDKKVAVYSAGTFGQQLINRIRENQWCQVTGWVDDDYWEYRRCCLNVDPVSDLHKMKFDYILVATVDSIIAGRITKKLTQLGVDADKILTVRCPAEGRKALLGRYLYGEQRGRE